MHPARAACPGGRQRHNLEQLHRGPCRITSSSAPPDLPEMERRVLCDSSAHALAQAHAFRRRSPIFAMLYLVQSQGCRACLSRRYLCEIEFDGKTASGIVVGALRMTMLVISRGGLT